MVTFILSQIFGGIALILVAISYFTSKKTFLLLQTCANVFYGAAFLVTFSFVAGINTFISMIRTIVFYFYEKKDKSIPLYYPFIFGAAYITVGIIFFAGYIDIIAIVSALLFTIAMMVRKMIVVNYLMLLPNIGYMIYCLCKSVYTSALLDLMELTIIVVAIIRYYVLKRKEHKKLNNII